MNAPTPDAERMRRVVQLWNWLPSFRAAAESAHLPSASALIGVSGPALSRSLKLVEEALGIPLFDRVGRRLQLNDAGGIMLVAVRNAMRLIDDALDRVAGAELAGSFRMAAWGSHASALVVPAIRALRASHPAIVVQVSAIEPALVATQLLEGLLDLAIMDSPPHGQELVCALIGELTYGVYVGKGHPLHGRAAEPDELARHPFVAPLPGVDDHWPVEIERVVGLRLASIHDATTLCATGELVAVLPDSLAAATTDGLWRLDCVEIRPEPVYLVHRKPLGPQPRLDAVVQALTDHARGLGGPRS